VGADLVLRTLAIHLIGIWVFGLAACDPDPGCTFFLDCQGVGGVRSCLNFCAPRGSSSQAETGDLLCPLDPCDPFSIALPDVYLCPRDHRCVDLGTSDPRLGVCRPAVGRWGEPCGETGVPFDQCGDGTFCAGTDKGVCPDGVRLLKGMGAEEPFPAGVCLPPRREGQSCDSNISDSDELDPATGQPRRLGCEPCERGTYCIPAEAVGVDISGRICARACELGGVPQNELCSCGTSLCEDRELTPADFPEGAPPTTLFCGPCTESGVECDGTVPCCDPEGACMPDVPIPGVIESSETTSVCCREDGQVCDSGLPFDACCPGSTCRDGQCQPCGRLGAIGTRNCCPGLSLITTPDGTVCAPCSSVPGDDYRCSPQGLVIENSSGGFDAVPVPDSSDRVPFRLLSRRSTRGGDLVSTAGDVQLVRVDLTEKHRAYLFPSALSSGTALGETAISLPFNDSNRSAPLLSLTRPRATRRA
jgi:hypothetical protein